MADPHQALGRFFDGELPESEVDGFRTHLASCRRCQAELDELMQLDVLGMRHLQLQALQGPRVVPIKPARHRPWWGWATASVALAATVVLVVSAPWPRGPSKGLWQPSKDERLVAARSSYPGAAQYHPLQRTLGSSLELPALPVKELAKLEDEHLAIAAAYLVRGDPGLVANALKELKADKTPDGDSERAMAHLVRGDLERADYEEALHFSERALQAASNHGPALWNKALALQGLGLTLMAAKTFDQVAQLGEPGWATEARQRAERLRAEANHVREEWNKAKAAADDLVKAGSTLTGEALRAPISRRLFYDAVRTRATAAEVMALLPLADQFDQQSGGSSLHDYVRWAAGRNFKVRGPVVLEYRRLLDSNDQSVARALSGSSEDDIALGAMAMFGHALDAEELRKLEAHVKALNDPWFDVYLLQMQSQFVGVKDLQEARKLLERALQVADASRLQYRSLQM
ncbi:MAG TPA: zf-HC2 domain-containing protein, partial [Myxococcaceae bacterium]